MQLLPAYRCYHGRLYKNAKWCHKKADATSWSTSLELIPGRTNEEMCLITKHSKAPLILLSCLDCCWTIAPNYTAERRVLLCVPLPWGDFLSLFPFQLLRVSRRPTHPTDLRHYQRHLIYTAPTPAATAALTTQLSPSPLWMHFLFIYTFPLPIHSLIYFLSSIRFYLLQPVCLQPLISATFPVWTSPVQSPFSP